VLEWFPVAISGFPCRDSEVSQKQTDGCVKHGLRGTTSRRTEKVNFYSSVKTRVITRYRGTNSRSDEKTWASVTPEATGGGD